MECRLRPHIRCSIKGAIWILCAVCILYINAFTNICTVCSALQDHVQYIMYRPRVGSSESVLSSFYLRLHRMQFEWFLLSDTPICVEISRAFSYLILLGVYCDMVKIIKISFDDQKPLWFQRTEVFTKLWMKIKTMIRLIQWLDTVL